MILKDSLFLVPIDSNSEERIVLLLKSNYKNETLINKLFPSGQIDTKTVFKGEGNHSNIIVCKHHIKDIKLAQPNLRFKFTVFLTKKQNIHKTNNNDSLSSTTPERRTLDFWFSDNNIRNSSRNNVKNSKSKNQINQFLVSLFNPTTFPRNYTGFLIRLLKLLEQFNGLDKILVTFSTPSSIVCRKEPTRVYDSRNISLNSGLLPIDANSPQSKNGKILETNSNLPSIEHKKSCISEQTITTTVLEKEILSILESVFPASLTTEKLIKYMQDSSHIFQSHSESLETLSQIIQTILQNLSTSTNFVVTKNDNFNNFNNFNLNNNDNINKNEQILIKQLPDGSWIRFDEALISNSTNNTVLNNTIYEKNTVDLKENATKIEHKNLNYFNGNIDKTKNDKNAEKYGSWKLGTSDERIQSLADCVVKESAFFVDNCDNALTNQKTKSQSFDVNDFKPVIGIITWLYCEKIAVDSMMDQKPINIFKFKTQGNHHLYTVGRIGEHTVVSIKLSTLGKSRGALISSTNAITRLLGTFPSIKHIICVGVGYGVNYFKDYRRKFKLGDIVVSTDNPGCPYMYLALNQNFELLPKHNKSPQYSQTPRNNHNKNCNLNENVCSNYHLKNIKLYKPTAKKLNDLTHVIWSEHLQYPDDFSPWIEFMQDALIKLKNQSSTIDWTKPENNMNNAVSNTIPLLLLGQGKAEGTLKANSSNDFNSNSNDFCDLITLDESIEEFDNNIDSNPLFQNLNKMSDKNENFVKNENFDKNCDSRNETANIGHPHIHLGAIASYNNTHDLQANDIRSNGNKNDDYLSTHTNLNRINITENLLTNETINSSNNRDIFLAKLVQTAQSLGILAFDRNFDPVIEAFEGNCIESYTVVRGLAGHIGQPEFLQEAGSMFETNTSPSNQQNLPRNFVMEKTSLRPVTSVESWEPYAALSAAAFAKCLIVYLNSGI